MTSVSYITLHYNTTHAGGQRHEINVTLTGGINAQGVTAWHSMAQPTGTGSEQAERATKALLSSHWVLVAVAPHRLVDYALIRSY